MYRILLALTSILLLPACNPQDSDDDPTQIEDTFDRGEMLTGWVDEVFIPRQVKLNSTFPDLENKVQSLALGSTDAQSLEAARTAFQLSYLTYQQAAPFTLAPGEAIRLRERSNTYPANVSTIESAVTSDISLELPSMATAQGFPALEYLLYGTDGNAAPPVVSNPETADYALLLVRTLDSLHHLHAEALEATRDAYVSNTGSSATGSVDRTVNDYIFYYEKFLRAGKVGIPAGVFSDDPLPDRVESLFAGQSRTHFLTALEATDSFFNDQGLSEYLDALKIRRDGELLSQKIRNQFVAIKEMAANVGEDFEEQVEQDNGEMLRLYDEMQKLTVLFKVDMLQALGINVDYVDADGD